jgi:hypothetical protein
VIAISVIPTSTFGQSKIQDLFFQVNSAMEVTRGNIGGYSIKPMAVTYNNALIWKTSTGSSWFDVHGDEVSDAIFIQEGSKTGTKCFLFIKGNNVTKEASPNNKEIIEVKFTAKFILLRFADNTYGEFPIR